MDTIQLNSGSSLANVGNLFPGKDVIISGSLVFPKNKKELLYYYIDLGWAITPNYGIYKGRCNCSKKEKCENPGKHPRTELNPITKNWDVLSTRDKSKVDEWLNDKYIKYSNWAVKCGKENGIIAIEGDSKYGGDRNEFDFPATLEYKTGGGGWRKLYQYPDFDIESNKNFGKGIELIVNGYITLPPSDHFTGGHYEWEKENLFIGKITKEFIALGHKPENKNNSGGYVLPDEIIKSRNPNLAELRKALMDIGVKQDLAHIIISDVNQNLCDIPKPQNEIDYLVEYGYRKYKDYLGEDINRIYEDDNKNIEKKKYTIETEEEAMIIEEDEKYILQDMIYPHSINFLCGDGGSKKTYSSLTQAIAIAYGKEFLGYKTTIAKVLYINKEMYKNDFRKRVREIKNGFGIDFINGNINFIHFPNMNLTKTEDINDFMVLAHQYDVIYLDALSDFIPGIDENSSRELSLFFDRINPIKDITSCAIVVIHHTTKDGKQYRGSSEIKNKSDSMLVINSKIDEDVVNFRTEKMRNGKPIKFDATCYWKEGKFWMDMTQKTPFDLSPIQRYIIRFGKEHENQFFKSDLEDDKKYHETSIRDAILELGKDGYIKKSSDAKYKNLYLLEQKALNEEM